MTDKQFSDIRSTLGWIALWLFFIAMNTCDVRAIGEAVEKMSK